MIFLLEWIDDHRTRRETLPIARRLSQRPMVDTWRPAAGRGRGSERRN